MWFGQAPLSSGLPPDLSYSYLKDKWGSICFQVYSHSCQRCKFPTTQTSSQGGSQHSSLFTPEKNEKCQARQKSHIFGKLFRSDISSHLPLFYSLLESLGLAYIKGEEFKQGHEYWEVRNIGNHFKVCLPHWVYIPEILNRSIIKQG